MEKMSYIQREKSKIQEASYSSSNFIAEAASASGAKPDVCFIDTVNYHYKSLTE